MKICSICGKRIVTQMLLDVTFSTSARTKITHQHAYIIPADACMCHTPPIATVGTIQLPPGTIRLPMPPQRRESVPVVFQDAFDKDLQP